MAESREANAARQRRLRADNPGYSAAKNHAWNAANPEKRAAHRYVEKAVRVGALTRVPCERCGTNVRVHAHHDDYALPLSVMWLCQLHHKERHRELDGGATPEARPQPTVISIGKKSGLPKGVSINEGKFRASVWNGVKTISVGTFATVEKAQAAVDTSQLGYPGVRRTKAGPALTRQAGSFGLGEITAGGPVRIGTDHAGQARCTQRNGWGRASP